VPGDESIVVAFERINETAQTLVLTQAVELVTPAGKHLVNIALVTDIPENLIGRRLENVMDSERDFDDAKIGSEVPACLTEIANNLLANLFSEHFELLN